MTPTNDRADDRRDGEPTRPALAGFPRALALAALLGAAGPVAAQPAGTAQGAAAAAPTPAAPSLTVYGFVKAEALYDTRQVVDVREGQFLLFPLPEAPTGPGGADVNGDPNLNLTAIQSRLGVRAAGARALGAAVSGTLEGDFFGGPVNQNISLFILRSAYVRMTWDRREVLLGQDWSPLFAPLFPGTISFNTGAPFQPFARQPQARLTLTPVPGLQVAGTLAGQRDAFAEIGGTRLQQRSGLPIAHVQVRYGSGGSVVGGGAEIKTIRPRPGGETFTAGAVQAFARVEAPRWFAQAKGTAGGDLADHLMTGGFAAEADGAGEPLDAYAPVQVAAGWAEVGTRGAPVTLGLFAGLSKALGTDAAGTYTDAAPAGLRAPTLDTVWRVAPRVVWREGPLQLAAEAELTSARYLTGGFDDRLRPQAAPGDAPVTNVRGLVAAYYYF